jgi:hypothetical protein
MLLLSLFPTHSLPLSLTYSLIHSLSPFYLLVVVDQTPDEASDVGMSTLLIILCLAFLLFFIGQSANIIRKRFGHIWKEWKYKFRTRMQHSTFHTSHNCSTHFHLTCI